MKKEEIISLTEKLHKEFEIVQLEERLETDPLAVMGMFGIESPNVEGDDSYFADYACENVCGCQGCNNITCVY